jgi:membrane protein YqaA with SNARE-associated domain
MDSSKRTRYVLFGIGAALGSAVGLVLGSLLAYWIGDETVRAIQRGVRRVTGGDDRPNFEMLLQ